MFSGFRFNSNTVAAERQFKKGNKKAAGGHYLSTAKAVMFEKEEGKINSAAKKCFGKCLVTAEAFVTEAFLFKQGAVTGTRLHELDRHFVVGDGGSATDAGALECSHRIGKLRTVSRAHSFGNGKEIGAMIDIAGADGVDDFDRIAGRKIVALFAQYGRPLVAKGKDGDLGAECTDGSQVLFIFAAVGAGAFSEQCIIVKFRTNKNIDFGQHGLCCIRIAIAVESDQPTCFMYDIGQPMRNFICPFQVQNIV